jgi:hypothetical protein
MSKVITRYLKYIEEPYQIIDKFNNGILLVIIQIIKANAISTYPMKAKVTSNFIVCGLVALMNTRVYLLSSFHF